MDDNKQPRRKRPRSKKRWAGRPQPKRASKPTQQQQQHRHQQLNDSASTGKDEFRRNYPSGALKKEDDDDDDSVVVVTDDMATDGSATATIPASSSQRPPPNMVLYWDSPSDFVPLAQEQIMVDLILERHGKSERGMLKDKPPHVVSKFQRLLAQKAPAMTMAQFASLRRHHIKRLNFFKTMPALRLGEEQDSRESARLFEVAVETFLRREQILFWSEPEQTRMAAQQNRPLVGTPDFLLRGPVLLKKTRRVTSRSSSGGVGGSGGRGSGRRGGGSGNTASSSSSSTPETTTIVVLEERVIHWIEVKMFYGASTIPPGKRGGAVGTILEKAQKYVTNFGPGALVFMMGCGDQLAQQLAVTGVTVLDCSSTQDFSLEIVHQHQRTWCANKEGRILP